MLQTEAPKAAGSPAAARPTLPPALAAVRFTAPGLADAITVQGSPAFGNVRISDGSGSVIAIPAGLVFEVAMELYFHGITIERRMKEAEIISVPVTVRGEPFAFQRPQP